MNDEPDNLFDRIAEDLVVPDVSQVHKRAALREIRQQQIRRTVLASAVVVIVAGIAWSVTRPGTSQVATSVGEEATTNVGEVASSVGEEATSVGGDSPVTVDDKPDENTTREVLMAGSSWLPTDRSGVPTTFVNEGVSFPGPTELTFGSCALAFYTIEWVDDGFVIVGPRNPESPIPDIGCGEGQEGVILIPVAFGGKVLVIDNGDSTFTLSADSWSLKLEPRDN